MFRVDLSLSFLLSRKKKIGNMVNLTKLHAFMGRLKMRYESLRNVAMHLNAFKCVKNAF